MKLFVTGIGTDVGKTVASAALVKALAADYWKPVQCGSLDNTDSMVIESLCTPFRPIIHPERYRLSAPMSPHAAAARENVEISLNSLKAPQTTNTLIIEGAGGALVPLNNKDVVLDIASFNSTQVIIVSRHYLGSINHTLLTIEAIKNRGITIAGIIWSGDENKETEAVICAISGIAVIGRIPETRKVTADFISSISEQFTSILGGIA